MIIAILAVLGIPIWFIAGKLGTALLSRHRFKQQSGAFRLKLKQADEESWSRMFAYGRVVRDVLAVNTGLALMQTSIHGFMAMDVLPGTADNSPFDGARVVRMTFDDSSIVQIAVDEETALRLAESQL